MTRHFLLWAASKLFRPTALQRGMGYVAVITVPVLGWTAQIDTDGRIWWRGM